MSKWPWASLMLVLAIAGWVATRPAADGPCYIHKDGAARPEESSDTEWMLVIPALFVAGFVDRRWFWLAPVVLTGAVLTSFLTCRELSWAGFWGVEFYFTVFVGVILWTPAAFGRGARALLDGWRRNA